MKAMASLPTVEKIPSWKANQQLAFKQGSAGSAEAPYRGIKERKIR